MGDADRPEWPTLTEAEADATIVLLHLAPAVVNALSELQMDSDAAALSEALRQAEFAARDHGYPSGYKSQPLAVVPSADVDAATRLRAAIRQHRIDLLETPNRTWSADERLWAAAAVGSVEPEGDTHEDRKWAPNPPPPARLSVCPTCGSDDPESMEQPCADRYWGISPGQKAPDPWHSPDTDRGR
jgi:hypothetical protein